MSATLIWEASPPQVRSQDRYKNLVAQAEQVAVSIARRGMCDVTDVTGMEESEFLAFIGKFKS